MNETKMKRGDEVGMVRCPMWVYAVTGMRTEKKIEAGGGLERGYEDDDDGSGGGSREQVLLRVRKLDDSVMENTYVRDVVGEVG